MLKFKFRKKNIVVALTLASLCFFTVIGVCSEKVFAGENSDAAYSDDSYHTLSESEIEWINSHDHLRVGYLNNYLPYSSTGKDGNATGIVTDIVPRILSELSISGIDISYVGFDNYDDMIRTLNRGETDIAFPAGGGAYYAEKSGISLSLPVASASTDLVYKGEYIEKDITHFAVNQNNTMQYYYVRTNFSDAEISFYPTIYDCLDAVLDGKVGATTLNGLRANEILKNGEYKGLYLKQLTKSDDRCFGVTKGNTELLDILNRGINILGPEYASAVAYQYASQLYSYTFWDVIRDYSWLFLLILLFVALILVFYSIRDLLRAQKATKLKSDFVSNMSHEIRTPVTAILGMNEMIQRECKDTEILKYSDNIEKACESLLGIINNILDFSKIEAGHMEVSKSEYSLFDLLRDLEVMVEHRASEKDLTFSMDIDKNLPSKPIGDIQKIRQVITNLLTNAVKYTEKGEVKLSITLLSSSDDEMIMSVSVKDTGIGIKENDMDRLYSAFDRLDLEHNGSIEGSGLGLAITQKMLRLMDSEIKVDSTYGEGSCFSFELKQGISDKTPIGDINAYGYGAASLKKRYEPTFTAPTARLLVVDDTPMNLQVICGLLKGNRLQLDTAESGTECIDKFEKNSYDAVFLDQRMPGMDGIETLTELKKRFPEKFEKTPVISLTANVLAGAREEMLKIGFSDYLTKPVKLIDMENMLLKYLPEEKIIKTDGGRSADRDLSMSTTIPQSLRNIEQLNIENGISYCGDESDYLEALLVYKSSAPEKIKKLSDCLENEDYEAFKLLIHSVKSTSKAIGADDLSQMAELLEKKAAINDTDNIKSDASEFLTLYRQLHEELLAANIGEE